jgi:RNA polymerase sigma-70 factor (ECF subfamily)
MRLGDVAAFERCFREYYDGLCAFATRFVNDRAIAEELVQDLFTHLWTSRARLEIRGSLRGYLYAAVRNRALNQRRRDAVEEDWVASAGAADVLEIGSSGTPSPTPDVHSQMEATETTAQVNRAFNSLPERCRMVMHLRWRDQMSYAEIAGILGISVKGVENQLARGLKALRERLSSIR